MITASIRQVRLLETLERNGFDLCVPDEDGSVRLGCSQCEATGINGTACHETGCPNQVHECHGCNSIVPRGVKYCEDCQ